MRFLPLRHPPCRGGIHVTSTESQARHRVAGLSPREREVLRLVCLGLTNGEIAERLILGEATVKTHVGAILGKLSARDRVAAVITGYESGLVAPGEVDVAPPLPGGS